MLFPFLLRSGNAVPFQGRSLDIKSTLHPGKISSLHILLNCLNFRILSNTYFTSKAEIKEYLVKKAIVDIAIQV